MPSPPPFDPSIAAARALEVTGEFEAAARAYLKALQTDPQNLDALLGFGALAFKTGHRGAAKTSFRQAVATHPRDPSGHANLGLLLSDEGDDAAARAHFETALRIAPDHRLAHRGLAILALRSGAVETARQHAGAGGFDRVDVWPYRGTSRPVSLLLVVSAVGPNVPIDRFIDDGVFQKWTLAAEFYDPEAALPDHDIVFHGIGEADRCGPALDAAASILSRSRARVLNPPSSVRATGRVANALRLGRIPGVVTPQTEAWSREALTAAGASSALSRAGFAWPLLLRSPGFHGGEQFVKVDAPGDLATAVEALSGTTIFVLQFLDTRGADAKFRKYRAMIVEGRLYPLHLAVSPNWKVHYFSADMSDRPEHRAEDEAFLHDMPRVLGGQAIGALERIRDLLQLDYGGIDFAIDGHGRVVVFEANASMTIVPPGDDERWRYRVGPIAEVENAVRHMLTKARATDPLT